MHKLYVHVLHPKSASILHALAGAHRALLDRQLRLWADAWACHFIQLTDLLHVSPIRPYQSQSWYQKPTQYPPKPGAWQPQCVNGFQAAATSDDGTTNNPCPTPSQLEHLEKKMIIASCSSFSHALSNKTRQTPPPLLVYTQPLLTPKMCTACRSRQACHPSLP